MDKETSKSDDNIVNAGKTVNVKDSKDSEEEKEEDEGGREEKKGGSEEEEGGSEEEEDAMCVLCGDAIKGFGNNPYPLAPGTCCDICNASKVIPARLKPIKDEQKKKETKS